MMQSVAADVFHSIETAGSHVYIEALPSLLHMSGTSAGAKRGCSRPSCPKGAPGQTQKGQNPFCTRVKPPYRAKPHLSAVDLRLQRAESLWSLQLLSWARPARALGQGRQRAQAPEQGPAQTPAQARGPSRALARPGRCGRAADPGPGSALAHLGGTARAAAPAQAQKRAVVSSWVYIASTL